MNKPTFKMTKKTQQAILKSAREMLSQGKTPSTNELSDLHLQDCSLHERGRRKLITELLDANDVPRRRSPREAQNRTIDLTPPEEPAQESEETKVVEIGRFKIKSVGDFKKAIDSLQRKVHQAMDGMPRERPIDVERYLVDQARGGNDKAFDLLQRVIES